MKVSTQIVKQIYDELKGSPLEKSISGKVCMYERPESSNKEDIVLSYGGGAVGKFQSDVVKCNIYVPFVTSINRSRFDVLITMAVDQFHHKAKLNYRYEVAENPTITKVDGVNLHFITVLIRITTSIN